VAGGTSDSPALAEFGNRVYVAWKGVDGDTRMFVTASGDGTNWGAQLEVSGGTSAARR
jgi:hypothetical protein